MISSHGGSTQRLDYMRCNTQSQCHITDYANSKFHLNHSYIRTLILQSSAYFSWFKTLQDAIHVEYLDIFILKVSCNLPDQGIHFFGLNIIHFLHSIFNLLLVSAEVNNKNKCVVILDLLHCRFSSQRIFKNLIMIQLVSWWCANAGILGVPVLLQCLWPMKCNRCPDLLGFLLEHWATWFQSLGCLHGMSFRICLLSTVHCTSTLIWKLAWTRCCHLRYLLNITQSMHETGRQSSRDYNIR